MVITLWSKALYDRHANDFSMKPLDSDQSLYFPLQGDILSGLSGTYVGDIVGTGDQGVGQNYTVRTVNIRTIFQYV